MPLIVSPLQSEGALVDILLGWSVARAQQLRAALKPVPPPIDARALLDTGAEVTCVDAALVQMLGLPLGGTVTANLPAHGGLSFGFLYQVSLTIVHPSKNPHHDLFIQNLSVVELSLAPLGYQALIGRDVLARCDFLYSGPKNQFELSY